MKFIEIKENKKSYLDLLLLADEQEDMICLLYTSTLITNVSP